MELGEKMIPADADMDCPACSNGLRFKRRFQIKVRPRLDEAALHEQRCAKRGAWAPDDFFLSNVFRCPHCHRCFQAHVEIRLLAVKEVDASQMVVSSGGDPANHFSEEEVAVLHDLRDTSLFDAMREVVHHVRKQQGNMGPRQMDRYFLNFLKTAVQRHPPMDVLQKVAGVEGGEDLEYWKGQDLGMILYQGRIHRFIPQRAMHPQQQKKTERRLVVGGRRVGTLRDEDTVAGLTKTRFGYVPAGARLFLAELQQSLGHRGRPMKDAPLRRRR